MSPRSAAILVTLAVLGLVAAFGIGVAANAISGDSIGLSARPLRAGDELAPAQAREPGDDNGGARTHDDLRPLDEHRVDDDHDDHHADDHDRGRRRPRRPLARRKRLERRERSSGGSGGDDSGGGRGRGRGRGGGTTDPGPRARAATTPSADAGRAPRAAADRRGPNARRDAAAPARDEAALAAPAR